MAACADQVCPNLGAVVSDLGADLEVARSVPSREAWDHAGGSRRDVSARLSRGRRLQCRHRWVSSAEWPRGR
jgi:hypothetical protein